MYYDLSVRYSRMYYCTLTRTPQKYEFASNIRRWSAHYSMPSNDTMLTMCYPKQRPLIQVLSIILGNVNASCKCFHKTTDDWKKNLLLIECLRCSCIPAQHPRPHPFPHAIYLSLFSQCHWSRRLKLPQPVVFFSAVCSFNQTKKKTSKLSITGSLWVSTGHRRFPLTTHQ